jgi:hypothetical protein
MTGTGQTLLLQKGAVGKLKGVICPMQDQTQQ